jgi:hypothetical protein
MAMPDVTTTKSDYEAPVLVCEGRLGDLTAGFEFSGNNQDFWGCWSSTS